MTLPSRRWGATAEPVAVDMNISSNFKGRLAPVVVALAALLLSGCIAEGDPGGGTLEEDGIASASREAGIEWSPVAKEIPGYRQRVVGSGAEAAVLIWPEHRAQPSPHAVIYLHAWTPVPPSFQADLFLPLLEGEKTAIYPVYQEPGTPAEQVQDLALAGIRAGIEAIDAAPETLVALGVNTGGALAFDYAALAVRLELPVPRAVVAIEPGREPDGVIPAADPQRIPRSVHLMTVTGPDSRIPGGRRTARLMLAEAGNVPHQNRRLYVMPRVEAGKSAEEMRQADRALFEERMAEIGRFLEKALASKDAS